MVHTRVLKAFVGPRPPGQKCRHLAPFKDTKFNNALSNIKWGTRSDNVQDMVRAGMHPMAKKIKCPKCGGSYSTGLTVIVTARCAMRSRSVSTSRAKRSRA